MTSQQDIYVLTKMFEETVRKFPDNVAVHEQGCDWTYCNLWEQSLRLAEQLRDKCNLQAGDRVGLLLPNSAEYVASYFGILMAGGVVVALNPDLTSRELAMMLNDCCASALLVSADDPTRFEVSKHEIPSLRGTLRIAKMNAASLGATVGTLCDRMRLRLSDRGPSPDHVAQIIYTSGTTGRPKGVTLSHRNLTSNSHAIVQYLNLGPNDSVFVILPFSYSYGNSLLLTHVAVGGRLVLATDFVFLNRALDVMCEQQVTGFSGVPASYAMLLHRSNFEQREFQSLRYVTCAGGALPTVIINRLRKRWPHLQIFAMYGQTEASARLSTLMPSELDQKPGSIGRGMMGVTLSVLDRQGKPVPPGETGEIVAQGDNVMLGYWNDPEATAAVLRPEGLRTGDLATVDDEGYIDITGRRNDMIKCGAYRISPQEIEDIILQLDGVTDVAVVGKPDILFTEVPVAFVVLSSSSDCLDHCDIVRKSNRQLARHKALREAYIVDSLPRTTSGKIKRAELREGLDVTSQADPDKKP